MDNVNSFTCNCPAGYTGDNCWLHRQVRFLYMWGLIYMNKLQMYAFVLVDGVIFELVCNK